MKIASCSFFQLFLVLKSAAIHVHLEFMESEATRMHLSRHPRPVLIPIYLIFFLLQNSFAGAETSNEPGLRPFDDKQHLAATSKYHSKSLGSDDIFKGLQANLHFSSRPVRSSHPMGPSQKYPEPSKAKTATGHIITGIYLHQQKKYLDAERQYHAALVQYPNYAFAHFNLGLLYGDMKKWAKAEDSYKKALRVDPNYFRAHNDLGILYARQQKYKSARKEFRKVIKLDSQGTVARLNLGHLYYYLERDYKKAKRHYKIALKLNPGLSLAKANIKKIDENFKRAIKAEGLFEADQSVEFIFKRDFDLSKHYKDINPQDFTTPLSDKKPRDPTMQAPLF